MTHSMKNPSASSIPRKVGGFLSKHGIEISHISDSNNVKVLNRLNPNLKVSNFCQLLQSSANFYQALSTFTKFCPTCHYLNAVRDS